MISGDGRTVTYTAFDKPEAISKAGNTVTVSYGPDRARFKRVDQISSGTITTLYAAGKSYELITTASEMRKKHDSFMQALPCVGASHAPYAAISLG